MKNWSRKFTLVCATISWAWAQSEARKKPAIVLADAADAAQWQTWSKGIGWLVVTPTVPENANADARAQAIAAAAGDAVKNLGADSARLYIAGRTSLAASVFYTISRIPDLFAAGIAIGGSPKPAIDSDRVFSANFTNTPVLWIGGGADDERFAGNLKLAGLNVEWRAPAGLTNMAIFEWLSNHVRADYPLDVDCETNSPTFASCYWIQPVKFDVGERNDVLPTTRVTDGSGAVLDMGGFGFKIDDPGPGVPVTFLPPKYEGPLKMGDRLLELDGKPIGNPRQFVETMNRMTQEKRVVVLTQRGKDRIRFETLVLLPRREAMVTSRIQAKYEPEEKDILIVSRMVAEMRLTIPEQWVPLDLYWNGLSLEDIRKPGCYLLSIDKELLNAAPCQ